MVDGNKQCKEEALKQLEERAARFSVRAPNTIEWIDEMIEALNTAKKSFRKLREVSDTDQTTKTSR